MNKILKQIEKGILKTSFSINKILDIVYIQENKEELQDLKLKDLILY